MTTCIRQASWVVAWDESAEAQVYLRDADVVFDGDRLTFVGHGFDGPVDDEIDGGELMVLPGLINLHTHPASEPMHKGVLEETGSPRLYMPAFYEFFPLFEGDAESAVPAAETAYCEMLKSGCTTVVDLSAAYPEWIETLARSGLRGVLGPMYRSGRPYTPDGNRVLYEWDEAAGRREFRVAMDLIDEAARHPSGRLTGMVMPAQIDTCTPELLQDSIAAAREKGVVLHTHGAQNWIEFHEMTRRHGMTPVQWMAEIGILGPNTILAHAIFIDRHPWIHWHTDRDLGILVETGTSVAHCPVNYSRRAVTLHNFGRYLRRGVNMGIGTDSFPHNILDEMRTASILCKVVANDVNAVKLDELLHAVTVGAAKALKRDDIGRLAPGCKADLVLVDLNHWSMRPARDPLKSLVFTALDKPIKDVYVDGRQVLRDGEVLTLDHEAAIRGLEAAQQRAFPKTTERDWANRSVDEASPMTLPVRERAS